MQKILVIGGAYQGKTKWAQEHFPRYHNISIENLLSENRQGKFANHICLTQFHLTIKQWLSENQDYQTDIALLKKNPSWLIISDEIGNGIVPLMQSDRKWREETGRVLCELAKEADEVYRIYYGIATKIKGSEV